MLRSQSIILNNGELVAYADYHQNNRSLFGEFSGVQCTGICAFAIAYSLQKSISSWNKEDIHKVLNYGNNHYILSRKRFNIPENILYLSVENVLGHVTTDTHIFYLRYAGKYYVEYQLDNQLNLTNLVRDLSTFTNHLCCCAIFMTNNFSYAIIKEGKSLFFFDSHSRNSAGFFIANGASSLRKFENINLFAAFIMRPFSENTNYALTLIDVEVLGLITEGSKIIL